MVQVLVLAVSMMAYARNTGTNLFPTIVGLFLVIGGTSARVLTTLSNAGVCISITGIERLEKTLSEDAIRHAVAFIQSEGFFYFIFDNVNIYLRKSQQRMFNFNHLIHATNASVIRLAKATASAFSLPDRLSRRGRRANAKPEDVLPSHEGHAKLAGSYQAIIILLLLSYCPGQEEWEKGVRVSSHRRSRISWRRTDLSSQQRPTSGHWACTTSTRAPKPVLSRCCCFCRRSRVCPKRSGRKECASLSVTGLPPAISVAPSRIGRTT